MRLNSIRLYPVKALQGVEVSKAAVEPWGLAGDRRWMVVDQRGRFLTQREIPAMAAVRATLAEDGIVLSAAGYPDLAVRALAASEQIEVMIWNDRVIASSVGATAQDWVSAVLGAPARLVYMADPASARSIDPTYAQAADRVSFADGFPLLVTTEASLGDLNRRLERPVPMERFRSNLVIEGPEAWEEDGWRRVRIGAATFSVVKPCARCIVTMTDQRTGARAEDREPLRTLQTFRRDSKGQVLFGQNIIPLDCRPLHVGDRVEVLA